ncbi:MAG: DUF2157 domain-containing protein [Cyclobacteriaceae bacterium]
MSLLKELPELLQAGVITEETADGIRKYYGQKKATAAASRSFTAFAIIGATLVGLGIILILAHNWDELSRTVKSLIAFMPLVAGQALCAYVLFSRRSSTAWREGSAVFLVFAVGASISLISQVYNIPGSFEGFILTWSLLSLPLVYIMQSSLTSLLYITAIALYAGEAGFGYNSEPPLLYFGLLTLIIPFYIRRIKRHPLSNFNTFHHWLLPASMALSFGSMATREEELMFVAFMSLFGAFYLFGRYLFSDKVAGFRNGFGFIGAVGMIIILLMLSFRDMWQGISTKLSPPSQLYVAPELYLAIVTTLIAAIILIIDIRNRKVSLFQPLANVFWLFPPVFVLGIFQPLAGAILVNLLLLVTGIYFIRQGAVNNHLGILNFGMLIIAALITCRFFDSDLPFSIRGILFILVGIGFFMANFLMIKKRRNHAA